MIHLCAPAWQVMHLALTRLAALLLVAFAAGVPAGAQLRAEDEPLLPDTISEQNIEMRGRYVRQWKDAAGTLVLLYSGGFELDFAGRRLQSNNAVIWIKPLRTEPAGRKYFELTVWLGERALVREPAGSTTQDQVLVVNNIRTFGEISKQADASSPENLEETDLFKRALRDRQAADAGELNDLNAPLTVVRPESNAVERMRRASRPVQFNLQNIEPFTTPSGEMVYVSTGRVTLLQGAGLGGPALSIQADNAVLFPSPEAAQGLLGGFGAGRPSSAPATQPAQPATPATQPGAPGAAAEQDTGGSVSERIRGVYLEGDVILSLGERLIRASRVYYDFENQQALMLDAVLRIDLPERGVPFYVRAEQMRQLSQNEYAATKARVSTSEFFTPSYHIGAEKVELTDLTPRSTGGEALAPAAGRYKLYNTTFNIQGLPVAWWPYNEGTFEQSETLIRRLRTGYSDDFGAEFETAWALFNLLGVTPPPGFDATLRLDYYTKRGPGIGVDSDYLTEDYFGLVRSYYINDGGEDNLGPLRDNEFENANRGRFLVRHRHYLPQDWELTLELSYISDPGFLEEYEKDEFFEGKDQETVIYLKRAVDTEAFTLLANWRLNDFYTQTEHLPDATYRRIGDVLFDSIVSYSEGRVGLVRYRPDDRRFFDDGRLDNTNPTDTTVRTDGRQEFEVPLKLAGFNIVPFGTVRGSYWDGNPLAEGTLWRGQGTYGVRGGTSLARVYDEVVSELLDINRIRHVVAPHYALWWSHSNTRSELQTPFDYGIETIDDFYGGLIGLRQTWQTKRGYGDKARTVDLLTFNIEAAAFGKTPPGDQSVGYANPYRPENSQARNYVAGDLIYRLSDTTSLLYDFNFDMNDREFDRHNVSIAVERTPRLAYVFGWRQANDIDYDVIGGGFNYRLSEKHILATRAYYDIDREELGEFSIAYIRKLQRWYVGFSFEIDEVFEETRISITLWPQGAPEFALGSRRFTDLGTTTGIRP